MIVAPNHPTEYCQKFHLQQWVWSAVDQLFLPILKINLSRGQQKTDRKYSVQGRPKVNEDFLEDISIITICTRIRMESVVFPKPPKHVHTSKKLESGLTPGTLLHLRTLNGRFASAVRVIYVHRAFSTAGFATSFDNICANLCILSHTTTCWSR